MVLTASSAYVKYGYEQMYRGGASEVGIFGKSQKITTLMFKTNMTELTQLYTPEVQGFWYGKSEGSCGVEYILSNPWVLSSMFHESSGTSSTTRWSSTLGQQGTGNTSRVPRSMNLEFGMTDEGRTENRAQGSTQDKHEAFRRFAKGVLSSSLSIKTSINNPVEVSQNLVWGYEDDIDTTYSSSNPPSAYADNMFDPYTFVHASIQLSPKTGSVTRGDEDVDEAGNVQFDGAAGEIGLVQDFDITFDNSAENYWGLGDPYSREGIRRIQKMTGKMSIAVTNSDNFLRVAHRETTANMIVMFSNGKTGSGARNITMNFANIGFGEHTVGFEPGEPVIENLTYQAASVNIVADTGSVNTPSGV